jgi:hypothetical protein
MRLYEQRRARGLCFAVLACSIVFGAPRPAAAQTPIGGDNVLVNPGAEVGVSVSDTTTFETPPSWTGAGRVTQARYGTDPRFPSAPDVGVDGSAFFAGGPPFLLAFDPPVRTMRQSVDLSAPDVAAAIDRGMVRASLSGLLGGFQADPDNATVVATFSGGDNPPFRLQIGPVSANDRSGVTTLLPRVSDGLVPAGMRAVEVVVSLNRSGSQSDYNDASADNVTLALRDETPPVVNATTVIAVTTSSAQVDAGVEDFGTASDVHVQYGDTTAYGQSSSAQASAGVSGPQALQFDLAGLQSNHDYHARVVIDGPNGSAVGDDMSFRTGVFPETTIDSGPSGVINEPTATFTFSSDIADATFECRIDENTFASCQSGDVFTGLADGPHTFAVRALAGATADPTPAARAFTVSSTSAQPTPAATPVSGAPSSVPAPVIQNPSRPVSQTFDPAHAPALIPTASFTVSPKHPCAGQRVLLEAVPADLGVVADPNPFASSVNGPGYKWEGLPDTGFPTTDAFYPGARKAEATWYYASDYSYGSSGTNELKLLGERVQDYVERVGTDEYSPRNDHPGDTQSTVTLRSYPLQVRYRKYQWEETLEPRTVRLTVSNTYATNWASRQIRFTNARTVHTEEVWAPYAEQPIGFTLYAAQHGLKALRELAPEFIDRGTVTYPGVRCPPDVHPLKVRAPRPQTVSPGATVPRTSAVTLTKEKTSPTLIVPARCAGPARCFGQVSVYAASAAPRAGAARVARHRAYAAPPADLADKVFGFGAGQTVRLAVPLNRRGRALVHGHKLKRVKVVLHTAGAKAKTITASRTARLRTGGPHQTRKRKR